MASQATHLQCCTCAERTAQKAKAVHKPAWHRQLCHPPIAGSRPLPPAWSAKWRHPSSSVAWSPAWLGPAPTASAAGSSAQVEEDEDDGWAVPPQLLSDCGRFVVQRMDPSNAEEVLAVVNLQTEAFTKAPTGFGLLDGLERQVFRAEVLDQMRQKLRYSPKDRFVLLVARTTTPSTSSSNSSIAGIVEVSLVADREVLSALRATKGDTLDTVPYLASMATCPTFRRQGVARLLLRAAEAVAVQWEPRRLTLHVYADNKQAVELYSSAGFESVWKDAGLLPRLGLARKRLLMQKWLD